MSKDTGLLHHTAPNAATGQVGECSPEFLAECQQADADIGLVIMWANEGVRLKSAQPVLHYELYGNSMSL